MVLVALVTSVMAPPVLRHAMARITQTDEELARKIDHDTWDGVERLPRAVVLCRRPVRDADPKGGARRSKGSPRPGYGDRPMRRRGL